jgi:6-phosphofructokinase 1
MRIGVLTAGGDCPGLNAVIRAVVRKGERHYHDELFGFLDGYRGLIDNEHKPLDIELLRGTLPRGGTILGTSRINPYMTDDGTDRVFETIEKNQIDAVIAIGGEGSLSCANELSLAGLPIVGVPKTIDNDIAATERAPN